MSSENGTNRRRSPASINVLVVLFLGSGATTTRAGFTLVDLGVLPTGTTSFASAINASGVVVGAANDSTTLNHAVFSSGGGLTSLNAFRFIASSANGISDNGYIAGQAGFKTGTDGLGNPLYQTHAFLAPKGGAVLDLGTAHNNTDSFSVAYAVNSSLQAAGASGASAFTAQAAIITSTGMANRDGSPSGTFKILMPNAVGPSAATAINANGDAAGWLTTANGTAHAFTYIGGAVRDVGASLFSGDSRATGINVRDDVVGFLGTPGASQAFYQAGAGGPAVSIGFLPGATAAVANAISDNGLVVGTSFYGTQASSGFLWDASTARLFDLSSLVYDHYQILTASGVNANEQIAATALINGQQHAVMLIPAQDGGIFVTPVPEPGSIGLVALGIALVAVRPREQKRAGPSEEDDQG